MRVKVFDTWSGESTWSEHHDDDEFVSGDWACDCLRGQLFNPRRDGGCSEGWDCRGHERWVIVDVDGEMVAWTLHDLNAGYSDELLFSNGVDLD